MIDEDLVDVVESTNGMTPFNHLENLQKQILSTIIASYKDSDALALYINTARSKLSDEFMAGDLFPIWKALTRYYPVASAIPDPDAFDEMISGSATLSLSERVFLSGKYREMSESEVSPAQFRLALVRLIERWRDEEYGRILFSASQIHGSSLQAGEKILSGFEDSQSYLSSKIADLERQISLEETSEGDINSEVAGVLQDYAEARDGKADGALTGFVELDTLTHGLHPGELCLVAAFTSEGKSKTVYNMAYHTCYVQGRNVMFGTNEATREQVRLNLIVRHSHNPKFGQDRGLRYSDIVHGSLSTDDEELFKKVLYDLRHSTDYGKMFVFQMPSRATANYLTEMVHRQSRLYSVGLLAVDYLELMGSTKREDLNDTIVSVKRLAVEYGIPILSPWQVSREAWREAQKSSKYTKAALADTSQAERASDIVISLLRSDEDPNVLKCQVLKNRSGAADMEFDLYTDFPTSFVSSQRAHHDLLEI